MRGRRDGIRSHALQLFWFLPKFIACILPCEPWISIFSGGEYDLRAAISAKTEDLLRISNIHSKLFVFCALMPGCKRPEAVFRPQETIEEKLDA